MSLKKEGGADYVAMEKGEPGTSSSPNRIHRVCSPASTTRYDTVYWVGLFFFTMSSGSGRPLGATIPTHSIA